MEWIGGAIARGGRWGWTGDHKTFRLEDGYAYQSSRRHPREPETVVLSDTEADSGRFVGFAWIDGTQMAAFKVQGQRRYFFQLPQNVKSNPSEAIAIPDGGRVVITDNPRDRFPDDYTIPVRLGYDTYRVFQQYWHGQSDPLYAVLSRRGGSVDFVTVLASRRELDVLRERAREIIAARDDRTDVRVARATLERLKGTRAVTGASLARWRKREG